MPYLFVIPAVSAMQVNVGINTSNCVITKLKMDKDRKSILERKNTTTMAEKKGKHTEDTVLMGDVD